MLSKKRSTFVIPAKAGIQGPRARTFARAWTPAFAGVTGRARKDSQPGFTLLEMIIVLVVVALIAGIFVGRMPARSHGLERRALVDAMVEALRGARGRAIGSNRAVTIAVNGEHGRFTVQGGPSIQLPDSVAMTAAAGPAGEVGKQLAGIRFAPDGSSSGGRIVLADGKRHTSIGIDWLTGRVSVADVP